jgi:hypothetical protein
VLRLAQRSREVTPCSSKEVPSDVTVHNAKEGIKGGKKRRNQRPQGSTMMTNHDNSSNGEASNSSVRHVLTTVHSDKH